MHPVAILGALAVVLASFSPAKTTVILLPDEDGAVGAVTLNSQGAARVIDQAYLSVSTPGDGAFSAGQLLDAAQVSKEHAALLAAMPLKPVSLNVPFESGSAVISPAAQTDFVHFIERVGGRKQPEILIAGHADATGTDALNMALSQQRALAVEAFLRERLPDLGTVVIRYFGAREPLIKTPPNVAEPRNRRVELIIY